jgi:peptidoglycan/LPS O-acetylase OafA/YrhL
MCNAAEMVQQTFNGMHTHWRFVMAGTVGNNGTIKSIQILRAIAAIMVAYLHSTGRGAVNLLPSSGGFGVDIFFIISGFVIASIASKETDYFFIKRLIRLVPLYIIATLIMVLACIVFPEKINHAVANFPAFIKSILFIPYKIETKIEPSGPILGQGWTLNYEMFFYIIMAVCIVIIRNKKYTGIYCASITGVIFISLNIIDSNIFILKYYQDSLFPEFIYSIILFYIYQYLKGRNKEYIMIRNNLFNVILFSLIGIICFVYMVGDNIYNWHSINNRNIYWGIPSLVLVFAFLNLEKQIKVNWLIKLVIKIGEASYVLYLFHTFMIMFFTRIVFSKIITNNSNLFVSIALEIIIMFSTVFASMVIYNILDKPIQKYLRSILKTIVIQRHST